MPDPVLRAATEEIKAILKKHDIAGVVVLGSKTHTEFLLEVEPSWSAAFEERNKEGQRCIRLRALRKDYPTAEAHREAVRLTSSLLFGLHRPLEKMTESVLGLMMMLGKQLGVEHMDVDEGDPTNEDENNEEED